MAASVGVESEKPRAAKYWSRFRDNVPSTDCESYYRWSVAVHVMANLINNLEDRMIDRNHTEIFGLLPSLCLSDHLNLDASAEELIKHFGDDLQCKIPTIWSELKRWIKQWRFEQMKNRRAEYSATATKAKEPCVDRKSYGTTW